MRYDSTTGVSPEKLMELVSRVWQIVSGEGWTVGKTGSAD